MSMTAWLEVVIVNYCYMLWEKYNERHLKKHQAVCPGRKWYLILWLFVCIGQGTDWLIDWSICKTLLTENRIKLQLYTTQQYINLDSSTALNSSRYIHSPIMQHISVWMKMTFFFVSDLICSKFCPKLLFPTFCSFSVPIMFVLCSYKFFYELWPHFVAC